jgi:hypothetical protein
MYVVAVKMQLRERTREVNELKSRRPRTRGIRRGEGGREGKASQIQVLPPPFEVCYVCDACMHACILPRDLKCRPGIQPACTQSDAPSSSNVLSEGNAGLSFLKGLQHIVRVCVCVFCLSCFDMLCV